MKRNLILLIVSGFIVFIGGLYIIRQFAQKTKLQNSTMKSLGESNQSTPAFVPQNNQQIESTGIEFKDETDNWKTYRNKGYSFKYPADWQIKEESYLNLTEVSNKDVQIIITESKAYPVGFGTEPDSITPLQVFTNGREYQTEEIKRNETMMFTIPLQDEKKHHIFVNNFVGRVDFSQSTLKEYIEIKPIVLNILRTFSLD